LCNKSKIYIPNAFTPNNDGLNDRFMPSGIGYSVIRSMRIFNRWGELVYEQLNLPVTDRSKGWDGTQRGMPLPPGVYVYTIEIECEENNIELFRNTFSLIR
ncbi:MAG TPA: gliding motility-associated C-terminal domain-containing protein, partial [Lacibacter sp.]|nr:gliding motility-associated C-terminal domain-containing protein [Lacibacter sp.]